MTTYTYHCVVDPLHEQAAVVDENAYRCLSDLMLQQPHRFHSIRLVIIESREPLSHDDLIRRLAALCYG